MVHRFGGLRNFCHDWYSHLMAAPRGSAYVLRQCKCVVQLIMVSSKIQMKRQTDLANLSDEELEQEIEILVREVFEVVDLGLLGPPRTWERR